MMTNERSQPILRLPRDQTPAEIIMHDGEQAQVFLFVAPGRSIAQLLAETDPFLPINFATGTRLVARAAIATLTVHVIHAGLDNEDLPYERQNATIRLCAGTVVKGELCWIAPPGRRRTLDYLNHDASHLVAHEGDYIHFIAKAHVASVEEVSC